MRRKEKTTQGITLIALVITIIVLLILAGVSIATLTEDNGLLIKLNKSKLTTKLKEIEEIAQMSYTARKVDEILIRRKSNVSWCY